MGFKNYFYKNKYEQRSTEIKVLNVEQFKWVGNEMAAEALLLEARFQ